MPAFTRSFACILFLFAAAARAQVAPAPVLPPPAPAEPNLRMTNDVRVYHLVKDAVVNISSTRVITARVGSGDEFFDRVFPGPIRQYNAESLGSGFVIHSAGYVITNEHVVDQATDVEVAFSDGAKLPAKVLATDNEHDLAVLKVDSKKPLQAIALGTSEDLMIGEPVYAIGNPFGYAGTMTRGIVSAVDRTLEASPTKSYKGLIQTDASINPGNSGGPLLNAYGQVVGINTAIRADAHGIGFAISVSHMRDLLPAFLNPEALNKAQVGFTVEEKRTTRPPATVLSTILVKQVQAGSEAEKAGLRPGDQIVGVNQETVRGVVDALVAMVTAKPGDSINLQVLRQPPPAGPSQAVRRIDLKIPVTRIPVPPADELLMTKMGIKGESVTPALVRQFRLPPVPGVFVSEVKTDSPAAQAGIQPGDVLFQIGRVRISTVDDLAQFLKVVRSEADVQFWLIRDNTRGHGFINLK